MRVHDGMFVYTAFIYIRTPQFAPAQDSLDAGRQGSRTVGWLGAENYLELAEGQAATAEHSHAYVGTGGVRQAASK
jgi:hypothetical protein